MPDRFGVPDNMFGPMPEDFYSAVGRVVLIAALLEVKLVDLLNTLDRVPQTTHAGKHGAELVKSALKSLESTNPALRDQGKTVLVEALDALDRRNDVVHNVWTAPTSDAAYGWRAVHRRLRSEPHQPHVGTTMSLTDLSDFIGQLIRLVAQIDDLRQQVEATL
ncbi:hypothetical protein [Nocardia nepalensis]|uniref:hypothetical protein n=1 Tax=Nocardia nepalensis TaxID=3375448 RepID=UPI003B671133